jgi:hypothetical protein
MLSTLRVNAPTGQVLANFQFPDATASLELWRSERSMLRIQRIHHFKQDLAHSSSNGFSARLLTISMRPPMPEAPYCRPSFLPYSPLAAQAVPGRLMR